MPNRLAGETSPYLLQHANNPVDWFPWGPDALARAKLLDRPIFLSIGYAACHWCHVMERESFEHESTARALNDRFVSIKVDREERPDLDSIYMSAVQAMTGSGGWPMSVFLTPDGAPFYGGTYFPDEPRHGMPSFHQVLDGVWQAWTTQRGEVVASGQRLVAALVEQTRAEAGPPAGATIDWPALLDEADAGLIQRFDPVNGSWGGAPKFPQPMTIDYLLRRQMAGHAGGATLVAQTLDTMADGGIHDQLGGGFHRYATDARWLVPHFEQMLYDNAQLARVYLHAWAVTRDDAIPRGRDRRARLRPARADDERRRVRLQPGRRHRGHRGPDLHLARGRDPRGARRRRAGLHRRLRRRPTTATGRASRSCRGSRRAAMPRREARLADARARLLERRADPAAAGP